MAAPDSSIEIIDASLDTPLSPVTTSTPISTTATAPPVTTVPAASSIQSSTSSTVPTTTPAEPARVPKIVPVQPAPKSPVPIVSPVKPSASALPEEPRPAPRHSKSTPFTYPTGQRIFEMDSGGLSETPWRPTIDWSNVLEILAELKDDIEHYEPLGDLLTDEVQFPQVNILLFGGVGAGKSSVFNTINSVFRGKIFNVARSGYSEHSLTTKLTKYPVMSGNSTLPTPMKFNVCDIRGLEQNHLMTKENMRSVLEGSIGDRFPLDPSGDISADMPGYKKHPDLHEKIHCVAIVQDATIVDAMQDLSPEVTKNIKDMQTVMNSLDVPQVVILTKIDNICEETRNDASATFRSPKVEKCVAKASEVLGVPRNSIFPMKNYESEYLLESSIDILALLTLKRILNDCDAHLFNHYDEIIKKYRVAERR